MSTIKTLKAAAKSPLYYHTPRRAPMDTIPAVSASSKPDGNTEAQASKHQPQRPALHKAPINGGQFNVSYN